MPGWPAICLHLALKCRQQAPLDRGREPRSYERIGMNEKLSGPESVELRWRTGAIGCLLPIMVGVCVLFGFAAFDAL